MALFDLNERLIASMVTRLGEQLPAAIDELNSELTDGIELTDDVQILDYIPTPTILNRFPTIGVQDGETNFEDDVGWGATGVHDLVLVTFEQDADQQRLARRLRRWARVVANVALAGRTFGDAWGVTLNGVIPGPTLGRADDPTEWISYVGVSIRCKTNEDST